MTKELISDILNFSVLVTVASILVAYLAFGYEIGGSDEPVAAPAPVEVGYSGGEAGLSDATRTALEKINTDISSAHTEFEELIQYGLLPEDKVKDIQEYLGDAQITVNYLLNEGSTEVTSTGASPSPPNVRIQEYLETAKLALTEADKLATNEFVKDAVNAALANVNNAEMAFGPHNE